jgi:hypothetical protein
MQPGGKKLSGAFSLKLLSIAVRALAVIEETVTGPSIAIILGTNFQPGIPLTFGFELTGVGGFIGINRSADIDVIRERLTSGAAGNVLFCSDPVQDGPGLLGAIDELFPARQGVFLVGPTLQISWLQPIVKLNLALLIELPGPRSIALLGSLQAVIGTSELPLVNLRLDFVGAVDLVKQTITFDASLINSSILGILTLTGDAAFRLCYGPSPDIVLSVGGFHPRFNAEALHLRPLSRLSASLSLSVPDKEGSLFCLHIQLSAIWRPNRTCRGNRSDVGTGVSWNGCTCAVQALLF